MASSDRVRCFVTLDLPPQIKAEAKKVQTHLKQLSLFDGRYTRSENIHLTLKFLGAVDSSKIKQVQDCLKQIQFSRPMIKMEHVGMCAPSIIWVKVDGADEIQGEVDRVLSPMFEPENRFMGHLTIARVKKKQKPSGLAESLEEIPVESISARSESLSLYQSVLTHEGPTYSVLQRYDFLPG